MLSILWNFISLVLYILCVLFVVRAVVNFMGFLSEAFEDGLEWFRSRRRLNPFVIEWPDDSDDDEPSHLAHEIGHYYDYSCCEQRMTWQLTWEEPGGGMIITDVAEAILAIENEILVDLSENETVTIVIAPHKMLTEHELEALPEFGGW